MRFDNLLWEYEFGLGTIAGVARKFGVHRRLVREALGSAVPPAAAGHARPRPRLGPVAAFIDAILEADRRAPRKQRHTAHRIWVRLQQERAGVPDRGVDGAPVRAGAQAGAGAAAAHRRPFVPQQYAWGEEAQVDWYEAYADLGRRARQKLQVFALRSMASGAAFHRAYPRATQQAFLEAHEQAFAYFGGRLPPAAVRQLAAAVKRILRGYRREETARFVAFRSHWRFEAEFCTPGEAHEKGGVEGEVGRFRRNHWVPGAPGARPGELNAQLLAACRADESAPSPAASSRWGRRCSSSGSTCCRCAAEGVRPGRGRASPQVDGLGRVRVRTNAYSVPLPAGHPGAGQGAAGDVEIWHRAAASPAMRALRPPPGDARPGALPGRAGAQTGRAGRQQAAGAVAPRGRWPASYDRFWAGAASSGRAGRRAPRR